MLVFIIFKEVYLRLTAKKTLFIFFSLFSSLVLAHETSLPSICFSSATHIIQRPLSFKKPEGQKFDYRFSVSPDWNNETPLLIFIPGGPGQTSMDMSLSYPDEMAIVRTDPRGAGCNLNSELTSDSFSSEEIAHDILALIRELKPKRYFIHGISYGTIPATIVAALAEAENLPKPEAVILEGTIGRPFEKNEYIQKFFEQWKATKALLPENLQIELSSDKTPMNLSSKEWASWISTILLFGNLPSGINFAVNELTHLFGTSESQLGVEARIQQIIKPPAKEKINLYKAITCREITPDVRDVKFDFDWSKGELVDTKNRLCKKIPFDHPFDAKNYQIKSRLYYFSGADDPATPQTQARYHFNSQNNQRIFISVQTAGHTALSTNLSDCSNQIWLSILAGSETQFENALGTCSLKAHIQLQKSLN